MDHKISDPSVSVTKTSVHTETSKARELQYNSRAVFWGGITGLGRDNDHVERFLRGHGYGAMETTERTQHPQKTPSSTTSTPYAQAIEKGIKRKITNEAETKAGTL